MFCGCCEEGKRKAEYSGAAPVIRIEPDRYRPVVGELHLHMCAEAPALRGNAKRTQRLHQRQHERLSVLWGSGSREARATPVPHISIESELRDDQRATRYIAQREIELAVGVAEDAEVDDLLCKQLDLGLGIGWADAKQDHQPWRGVKFADDLASHCDAGMSGPL